MKNKFIFSIICGISILVTACGSSSNGKPMSAAQLAEHNETVAKVQQVETLLDVVPNMEADDIIQRSH